MFACGDSHLSDRCPNPRDSLSAVVAGANTRRTKGDGLSGKKRRRPLQSKRPSVSERTPPKATPPLRNLSGLGLSAKQMALGDGVESRRPTGRVVKTTITPPKILNQKPFLNWSRRRPSRLTRPQSGRRPGLRCLSPNPQKPLGWLLEVKEESQRNCQNRGHQTHNTRPGGPNPKFHLPN